MRVRFSERAALDLEEIGDFIAADDPERAETFVGDMRRACLELGTSPTRYPLVARYKGQAVRRRLFGKYLIFHRVIDGEMRITRILHGARDYDGLSLLD